MSWTGQCIDQHLAGELEYVQIDYIIDRDVDDIGTVEVTRQNTNQQKKACCGAKWNRIRMDD